MSSYLAKRKEDQQIQPEKVKAKIEEKKSEPKKKLSYMEQKEWATIEDEIAELENRLDELQEEMNHQGDDFTRLQELQKEVTTTEELLEEKMSRWEYLSEWADN